MEPELQVMDPTTPESVEDPGVSAPISFPDNLSFLAEVVDHEVLSQNPARVEVVQGIINDLSTRDWSFPPSNGNTVRTFWEAVRAAEQRDELTLAGRQSPHEIFIGGFPLADARAYLRDGILRYEYFREVSRYLRGDGHEDSTFEDSVAMGDAIQAYEWTPYPLVNAVLNWDFLTDSEEYVDITIKAINLYRDWIRECDPRTPATAHFQTLTQYLLNQFQDSAEHSDVVLDDCIYGGFDLAYTTTVVGWDEAHGTGIFLPPDEPEQNEEAPEDEGLNDREDGVYRCNNPECEDCNPPPEPTLSGSYVVLSDAIDTLLVRRQDEIVQRRSEIKRLSDEMRELRGFPKAFPSGGFPAVAAYISSGEISEFRVRRESIEFRTGPIYVFGSDFCFGKFAVSVSIEHGSVSVHTSENNTQSDNYWHPHVDTAGSACLGRTEDGDDFQATLKQLIREGDLDNIISRLLTFLRSYNPSDPHRKLWHWDRNNEIDADFCEGCERPEGDCECNWCDYCDQRTSYEILSCNICEGCCEENHRCCNSCESCFDAHDYACEHSETHCDTCCQEQHFQCSECSKCAYKDSEITTDPDLRRCNACYVVPSPPPAEEEEQTNADS